MNVLQKRNAKLFTQLLAHSGLTVEGEWEYIKLTSEGFMDLSIDRLFGNERSAHFAMAHNFVENGDVMADPDMEICFVWAEEPYIIAMHYQNDYPYAFNTVERGNATQDELDSFMRLWLTKLLLQGHKIVGADLPPSM